MQHAVIFDVDGVLVDSYQPHYESWRILGEEQGLKITEAMFRETFGRTSRDIIRHWWGQAISDAQAREMDERKEALYREVVEQDFPAMDGAAALIDALRSAGFLLAVGSSGPKVNVDLVLRKLGKAESFGAKITGQDVTRGKPDPQVFQLAAQRLGVSPACCVVVEDAPAGVQAAKRAGMTAIALLGTAPAEQLSAADRIVASLRELSPASIKSMIGG